MGAAESSRFRQRRVSWRRLLAWGVTLAALAAAAGFVLEWRRFGASTAGAIARTDAEIRARFDAMTAVLARVASAIAADPAAASALQSGPDAARALFDVVDRHSRVQVAGLDIAVTVYEPGGTAVAWAGRAWDIPDERTRAAPSWFVTPSPLGLRLVHVQAVGAPERPFGVVAVEYPLSPSTAGASIGGTANYSLDTRIGPASLRLQYEGAGEQARPNSVILRAPGGQPLVEANFTAEQVRHARATWRRRVAAATLTILGVTLLLLIGPILDGRAAALTARRVATMTAAAVLLLLAGGAVLDAALRLGLDPPRRAHGVLALWGSVAAAAVALLASPIARLRVAMKGRRRPRGAHRLLFAADHVAAGGAVLAAVIGFSWILGRVLDGATVDLRHLSLHPWNAERLTLLAGMLACHLALIWLATLVLAAAISRWLVPRGPRDRGLVFVCWLAAPATVAVLAAVRDWPLPPLGLAASAAAAAVAALFMPRAVAWFRHAAVAGRILALFVTFLVPTLLLYPALNFFTERNVRAVVAEQYSAETRSHHQTLQERLAEARESIDALDLSEHVKGPAPAAGPTPTDSAFYVWKQTALARERLTSAVELYDISGALVSRFALNFPEYAVVAQAGRAGASCEWEVYGEALPFGSDERRILHAERSICEGSGDNVRVLGTIVVHVEPDYRTLSFITSQSPYFEVFRSGAPPRREGMGHEVAIAIYGWGLTPLYSSGAVAWPIDDALFDRIYRSREPFWTVLGRGTSRWHVHVANDRSGIYAIGYPALSVFDRLVHIAELTTLAGVAYLLVLLGTAVFTRVARERPRVGRALLREIRASFYRKLLLAFVLASIIPVLTLALVIRTYFAGLLLENVEAEATRAASVAQRVIEESAALQLRAGQTVATPTDDDMIWISQVIDQDVNVFRGPRVIATSELDLFASGLLPTRTPDEVYRAIALQRLPGYVGEDRIGAVPYLIAAAPVRAGDQDAILTVPLANQQREIEREIDELDRGVHLAALFFILAGAAIGLSMAERIADPVRRLTRATRRIARGDFDERIAVRSADELRRLVDAFNSMAAELKAQRVQLERTHRLEAWAEMARQVAHEIKNPLTPIQLSAEHLRRVHEDRGEPMGAVLEHCVTSILGQVRLLRQISSEFSSFASSPTARPAPVDLPPLVAEVVDPYRVGLQGRVVIDNRVAPPLPRVVVDRTLIARALSNIVENALHAMPGQGTIGITAEADGDVAILRVQDSGVGMDADALARVFEPYFSTKASGTGLGLPIARRNVELSGGRIEVESVRGQGTTVILKLPVEESQISAGTRS